MAQRLFCLRPDAVTPAHAQADGIDFVPTRPQILFGHHYASIAGLAPMLGPAVAVIWGWLPALLWVVFGSIFIGCVHDFTALVLSVRHKGASIGSLTESILGPAAKAAFLLLILFGVSLAMGVFVEAISTLFLWGDDFDPSNLASAVSSFPEAVLPSSGLMLLAMGVGWLLYIRRAPLLPTTLLGFAGLLGLIWLGYRFPTLGISDRAAWPEAAGWKGILLAYAYLASVLPVWLLLQARDFLNSLLLYLGLALLYTGLFLLAPDFAAPAVNPNPSGAPPVFPFVFITIACGAASGFHALVSSGTTSKQLDRETHARPIGYGGMIGESLLGLIAVLACTAALPDRDWATTYADWSAVSRLGDKLGVFIGGASQFVERLGVSRELSVTLIAMVVVSFALTTLDSATRLLRYNVQEAAESLGLPLLGNRFLATALATAAIGFFAFYRLPNPADPSGTLPAGLALWHLFGATNQLIAGLALLVGAAYLRQRGRTCWPLGIPAVFMLGGTFLALVWKIGGFLDKGWTLLAVVGGLLLAIGLVVLVAAWRRLRPGQRTGSSSG